VAIPRRCSTTVACSASSAATRSTTPRWHACCSGCSPKTGKSISNGWLFAQTCSLSTHKFCGRAGKPSKRVVIIGANFAGLSCAQRLSRRHAVTVVDSSAHFEFLPNIHELLSGMKKPALLRLPRERLLHRLGHTFLQDTVVVAQNIPPPLSQVNLRSFGWDFAHCFPRWDIGGSRNIAGSLTGDGTGYASRERFLRRLRGERRQVIPPPGRCQNGIGSSKPNRSCWAGSRRSGSRASRSLTGVS
jgi:hypothetical protein